MRFLDEDQFADYRRQAATIQSLIKLVGDAYAEGWRDAIDRADAIDTCEVAWPKMAAEVWPTTKAKIKLDKLMGVDNRHAQIAASAPETKSNAFSVYLTK